MKDYFLISKTLLRTYGCEVACMVGLLTDYYIKASLNNELVDGYVRVEGMTIKNDLKVKRRKFKGMVEGLSVVRHIVSVKHVNNSIYWYIKIHDTEMIDQIKRELST